MDKGKILLPLVSIVLLFAMAFLSRPHHEESLPSNYLEPEFILKTDFGV